MPRAIANCTYCSEPIWSNKKHIPINKSIFTAILKTKKIAFLPTRVLYVALNMFINYTAIDRHFHFPTAGGNRYRYAIPQPIHRPIVILNKLLPSNYEAK